MVPKGTFMEIGAPRGAAEVVFDRHLCWKMWRILKGMFSPSRRLDIFTPLLSRFPLVYLKEYTQ